MKTLEQILERIKNNTYQESDMYYILGYLEAKGIKMDDFEFNTPNSSDNSDDFIEWFEEEEEKNKKCYFVFATNGVVLTNKALSFKGHFIKNKEEKKLVYKYQGEERFILNKEIDYKKEVFTNLESMATYYSDKNILVAIENLRKEIDEIYGKLQEVIDEK